MVMILRAIDFLLAEKSFLQGLFLPGFFMKLACDHGGYRYTGCKMINKVFNCGLKLIVFMLKAVR